MTSRLSGIARDAARGTLALGSAVAVFYAGALLLFAAVLAREGSKWCEIYVYADSTTEVWESDRTIIDIVAQPPLNVWGWLPLSAFVVALWVIVVGGLWIIAWANAGLLHRGASARLWLRPGRIALPVLLWGIAALSAYALAIFLWDWIEWKHVLDAGLTLPGDPLPGPYPAFDQSQIPWGIVTFVAIGALAVIARMWLRRRRRDRALGTPTPGESSK